MKKVIKRIDKYSRREFWPMRLAYLPGLTQRLFNSIKAKSLVFPLKVNDQPFGRISPYSKYEIGEILPQNLIYKTELYIHSESELTNQNLRKYIEDRKFKLPFVIKPDYGERGKGVQIIRKKQDFEREITQEYLNFWDRILIQEYANEQIEVGIGYAYDPITKKGKTTGMVVKEFLTVVGDGVKTIGDLVTQHARGHFYLTQLQQSLATIRDTVIDKGVNYELLSIGNHARGSTFHDQSHKISKKLEESIVQVSESIPGFYFGRYDIRANTREELMDGLFRIIELNGADSEPTRIYDPKYRFWQGRYSLWKRQSMIFKISQYRKTKGVSIGHFLDDMYSFKKYLPNSIVMLLKTRNAITRTLVARLIIAVILVQTLYFKFGGHPESVELFTKLRMEPRGRIGTGIIELFVSIGIFVPKLKKISLLGVIGLMMGAIFFHITILGVGDVLFVLAILCLLLALAVLFNSNKGK